MDCLIDNYSKQSLEQIVKTSKSMAELVKKLGYKTTHGKNYETVQKRLEKFNISTEHFIQIKSNKTFTEEEVFCENSLAKQQTVRRLYLKQKDVEYKCAICGTLPAWNGQPLALQLDHIDGDNTNHSLDNIRWLCPNCHSQTRTFAGKNVKKERQYHYCVDCGKEISKDAIRCIQCDGIFRTKPPPVNKDTLEQLLQVHQGNFAVVAKLFNVADNTVRKWCKKYELPSNSSAYKEKKPPKITKPKSDQYKPCYMIDKKTDEILMEFSSRTAAEKYLNIPRASDHIGKVCNGKRVSAYGYKWKDKEEVIL